MSLPSVSIPLVKWQLTKGERGIRIEKDYRHHATDVIAGSILGALIAFTTYHLCASSRITRILSPRSDPSNSLTEPPRFVLQQPLDLVVSTRLFSLAVRLSDYPSLLSPKCHLPFSPRIPPTAVQDRMALDSSTSGASDGIEDETAPRDGNGNGHVLPLHAGGRGPVGYSREFGQAGRESHDGGRGGAGEVPLEPSGWGQGGPYAVAAVAAADDDSKKQSADSFQVQARQ